MYVYLFCTEQLIFCRVVLFVYCKNTVCNAIHSQIILTLSAAIVMNNLKLYNDSVK